MGISCEARFFSFHFLILCYVHQSLFQVHSAMATSTKPRTSSFSRNVAAVGSPHIPGLKYGPNGTAFLSSGIPDLDSNFPFTLLLALFVFFFCFSNSVKWYT